MTYCPAVQHIVPFNKSVKNNIISLPTRTTKQNPRAEKITTLFSQAFNLPPEEIKNHLLVSFCKK